MSLTTALLGFINWKPFSGYELKKVISDSDLWYWSGNNNQIYTTLLELHRSGAISQEIIEQENLPAKKLYTITDKGKQLLQESLSDDPQIPEFKNGFLTQLAWADILPEDEFTSMLDAYQAELEAHVLLLEEKQRRQLLKPERSQKEAIIWKKIDENIPGYYKRELEWVIDLRNKLQTLITN